MTSRKRQDSSSKTESLEKLITKKARVVENIIRIRQSILEKTIVFIPVELDCRLDILKNYIDQAMKLQSDVDNLDTEKNYRADHKDIYVTTKSLFLSLLTKNGLSNVPEMVFLGQPYQSRLPNMKLRKIFRL